MILWLAEFSSEIISNSFVIDFMPDKIISSDFLSALVTGEPSSLP